jgi:hypothetical protein
MIFIAKGKKSNKKINWNCLDLHGRIIMIKYGSFMETLHKDSCDHISFGKFMQLQ